MVGNPRTAFFRIMSGGFRPEGGGFRPGSLFLVRFVGDADFGESIAQRVARQSQQPRGLALIPADRRNASRIISSSHWSSVMPGGKKRAASVSPASRFGVQVDVAGIDPFPSG